MKGSVTRCTGLMTEKESIEAFLEGTKLCISAARELAIEHDDKAWDDVATVFRCLHENGYKLAHMRSMTRYEVMEALNMKTGVNMNPLKSQ